MGFIRPKIYLPSALSEQEQSYIILHEQHHIRRGDHIIKALAFIALCIHWFNPLVWVAFVLSSKDMEMSCDEAVVKKLGEGIRADYSASLLSLATGRRIIAGTPLAFGEGDTKSRIKNMLKWKKPKTWIMLVALVACVVAIAFCATNPRNDVPEEDSMVVWELDQEYPDAVVDIVNDYIMQQVEYYNSLGSGENAIGGEYSITGAKVINLTKMVAAGFADAKQSVELYRLEYRLRPSEPDHVVLAGGMQMEDGWITEWGSTGQPHLALLCDWSSGEEIWARIGVTNTDVIDHEYNTDNMLSQYNDKYDAAAMELYKAYLRSEAQTSYGTAEDISYYLELAAGETFRNMTLDRQISLLVEYEDLLDDYTLIARETEDGRTAYIVGQYNGNPTESPLYGVEVTSADGEDLIQFLYREEESETVNAVLEANKTEFPPSAGYSLEQSSIIWREDSGVVLILPRGNKLSLNVAWNRYLYTPNGREYIEDAVSRGIDVCGRTDTFLYVYLISEQFGEIAERIALTEAEAQAILAEERVKITDGFGFSASLHIDGQTTYFNEREGAPQSVIDLAVEKCGYKFESPSAITGNIVEATLDMVDLDTTLRADESDLPRLKEILTNAEFGYVGACGYGAKLTLTLSNGEKLVAFKGCDSCDTMVFGSYGGYFLGDKENIAFWEMFDLDPDTKERVEANPNGRELLYKDEELLISVPAQYAHLVKMDGIGSDNMFTVAANFYYKPEYTDNDSYTPMTNGGWLLTVRTMNANDAPHIVSPSTEVWKNSYLTTDGRSVYQEIYPAEGYYGCSATNLAEFKAVMDSIQVDYIGLEPFKTGTLLPAQQLSAAEHAAAVNAIFTNLRTDWWNGKQAKNCAYESAAFECLYREVNGNIVNLHGHGGYFRWDRSKTCIEQWYAPTIVTLDTDTQQALDLWWPGDGAAYESSILDRFPESIASTVAEPDSGRYAAVRAQLMEASKESMVSVSQLPESGQTRRFGVQDLRVEITNVLSVHKTSMLAEGIEPHEYVVVSCTPESKITVLDAGMSDPTYAEDGKLHPQWGLLYTDETERTRITDEIGTVPVTSDLEGIYNLEASLFVIQLNMVD